MKKLYLRAYRWARETTLYAFDLFMATVAIVVRALRMKIGE